MLKIEHLKKSFGDKQILEDISLQVESGEIVSIIGSSGTGKTTLLRCINFLEKPDRGVITIDDVTADAAHASAKEIHKLVLKSGMVFQSYNLTPDLTVRENIEMTAELVQEPLSTDTLIEELGLKKYETHFPKELSGGQQQRVAIARAMVKKPDILLCDELTGALDTKSSKDVLQRVQKMNDTYKTTVVIITHNLNIAGMADRIIKITDGKVVSNQKNADKKRVEEMEL